MVGDVSTVASYRIFTELNRYAYPSTYYDGGNGVLVGGYTDTSAYTPLLIEAGMRPAPNLDLITAVNWLGNGIVQIKVKVGFETTANIPPDAPTVSSGDNIGLIDTEYRYTASGTDPESSQIYYQWDYGNGEISNWIGPFASGDPCSVDHSWTEKGLFDVKVRIRDEWNFPGEWSEPFQVQMGCCEGIRGNIDNLGGEPGIDIADLVYTVEFQFNEGPPSDCFEEADFDATGEIDIADLVYLVEFQFDSGPPPLDCY